MRPARDALVDWAQRADGNEARKRKPRVGTQRMISPPRRSGSGERTLGLFIGSTPKRVTSQLKRVLLVVPSAEINESKMWAL